MRLPFSETRLIRSAFWLLVAAVWVLSLTPSQNLPKALMFWDKAQHALAFVALGVTGLWAYPERPRTVGLGLLAMGVGIEWAQSATGWRHGDVLDWLADAVGVALGWALAQRLRPWRGRSRTPALQ